jgi:hypothetical protein
VLLDREALTPDEIFTRYYSSGDVSRDVIVDLWVECAKKLKVPATKLRPTDRFEHELGAADFFASLDDSRDDLSRYAIDFARRRGATVRFQEIKMVDDLIRQLAEVQRKAG